MENLLDKHGWKFEADYKSHYKGNVRINKGEVIVKDGYAFLKEGTLHMIPVVTGTPRELEFAGITNFRLLEPESKEEEKELNNESFESEITALFKKYGKESYVPKEPEQKIIRRETATQFACAIIQNSHDKNYQRNTVNDGWWGNHVLDEAIALTDELLSKLNSK